MSRVLVVYKFLTIGFLYRDVLQASGYSVSLASTGEEAYLMADREPFDLVVIDDAVRNTEPSELLGKLRELQPYLKGIICTTTSPSGDPYAWDGIFIKSGNFTILQGEVERVSERFSGSFTCLLH
jgi:DNA-binding NtrC family response regulator